MQNPPPVTGDAQPTVYDRLKECESLSRQLLELALELDDETLSSNALTAYTYCQQGVAAMLQSAVGSVGGQAVSG